MKAKIEVWQDKPYAVLYFQSHPDEGHDDCITSEEYATLPEAEAAYEAPPRWASGAPIACEWIVLEGTGGDRRMRRNPDWNRNEHWLDDDAAERSEHAMQQGMAFGVEAYNEAMGWEVGAPDEEEP